MELNVNKVALAGTSNVGNVSNVNTPKETAFDTNLLEREPLQDTVNLSGRKDLTDEEKKELVLKARTRASGYSFFFGPFSVLYYGLKSDNAVAEKYDLDPKEDKKLIKKIKKEQLLWTLPACIPGLHLVAGGAAYLYNKNCDADDINL